MAKAGRPKKIVAAPPTIVAAPPTNVKATAKAPLPYPYKDVSELIDYGWHHTHTAGNGNRLFTKGTLEGERYAEVDSEGKVVDIRNTP